MGRKHIVFPEFSVFPLNDATDLDVWQSKGLGQILNALSFHNRAVEHLACQRRDGTITPLTGKVFNSTIVKGQGVKYLAKTFTLPNVQVGSIIEWKYTEFWEDYVFAPHWILQDDLLTKRAKFSFVPMLKQNEEIVDSRGQILDRVYYSVIGLPESTQVKTTANNRMELELKDIPAFEPEDFEPPSDLLKMRINFYYGTDKMAKPQEFRKNKGKRWKKGIKKFYSPHGGGANDVSQAYSPTDTAEQKAR